LFSVVILFLVRANEPRLQIWSSDPQHRVHNILYVGMSGEDFRIWIAGKFWKQPLSAKINYQALWEWGTDRGLSLGTWGQTMLHI